MQRTLLTLLLCLAANTALAERPNILLVFIDDMGWGDFSCFGNESIETQNIDRLAAEGIRFEQFLRETHQSALHRELQSRPVNIPNAGASRHSSPAANTTRSAGARSGLT